jgi:hypothetical protein
MAQAIPIILLAASAAISYKSYSDQKKAAKNAEKIGMMNAAATEAEAAEQARRLKENQMRVLAETSALSAASGVAGGSQDIYLSDMAESQMSELNWVKKSGASRAEIERLSGQYQKKQGEAAALGTLSTAVQKTGSAYSAGADWYNTH